MNYNELAIKAKEIRQLMVCTILANQTGHPGGSFSCVDILTSLYFKIMTFDPKKPNWPDRDRFILSKGHASLAYYSTLSACGFFDKDLMKTFRQNNSILSGHPDMKNIPGVDMSTGSLGQGLSIGCGMAFAAKLDKKKYKVFVLIGDGESQEGQVWEAALFAAHHKLDNLIVLTDKNKLQLDGYTENILKIDPLFNKWESFGWEVSELDGNNVEELCKTILTQSNKPNKPKMIIANTIKGKGLKLMENKCEWHGMKCQIKEDDAKSILEDVELNG